MLDIKKLNSNTKAIFLTHILGLNGLNQEIIDKLINVTQEIDVKEFDIYTSCEAYGEQAEYIRDGLNYEVWRKNLVHVIENANIRQVVIMMTINSLCLFSKDVIGN